MIPGGPGPSELSLAIRTVGELQPQAANTDPNAEREPPPPPTQLEFPHFDPPVPTNPPGRRSGAALLKCLLSIKGPSDIGPEYFDFLKIKVTHDVDFSGIIPADADKYLPPLQWWDEESGSDDGCAIADSSPPKLGNGIPAPEEKRYSSIRNELLFANEDAYRELDRLPPLEGRSRARVTQTRKFFAGLRQMAEWWDSSGDKYMTEMGEAGDGVESSEPKTKYKGYRIGTGRDMPEATREITVQSFVEMIAWAFGCQVTVSLPPPRLAVQTMYFPVRKTYTVNRSPSERHVARKGIQEGPVMTIQCRPETRFRKEGENVGKGHGEMCDLLREVAAMLLLAQERAREGVKETRPGEGKWWTSVPRWGGGSGGEMGNEEGNGDEKLPTTTVPPSSSTSSSSSSASSSGSKLGEPLLMPPRKKPTNSAVVKKQSMAEKWKTLQPGASLWNKKMRYMQIGKVHGAGYDDVFMISSINHHVSILRLRVHGQYLEWLATGKVPPHSKTGPPQPQPQPQPQQQNPSSLDFKGKGTTEEQEQEWYVLHVRRTKWFDLFDVKDRVEALDGVWGVMGWMTRGADY